MPNSSVCTCRAEFCQNRTTNLGISCGQSCAPPLSLCRFHKIHTHSVDICGHLLYRIVFILGEKCIKYCQVFFTPLGEMWLSPRPPYETSQRRSNNKIRRSNESVQLKQFWSQKTCEVSLCCFGGWDSDALPSLTSGNWRLHRVSTFRCFALPKPLLVLSSPNPAAQVCSWLHYRLVVTT